jgi:hypothetical protein
MVEPWQRRVWEQLPKHNRTDPNDQSKEVGKHQQPELKRGAIMEDKVRDGVSEDRFTGAIESQTSKRPSSGYLAAAFGAITASAILKIIGKDDWALFVGHWPAAFLLMGVYSKMVKQHGSDAYSKAA